MRNWDKVYTCNTVPFSFRILGMVAKSGLSKLGYALIRFLKALGYDVYMHKHKNVIFQKSDKNCYTQIHINTVTDRCDFTLKMQ